MRLPLPLPIALALVVATGATPALSAQDDPATRSQAARVAYRRAIASDRAGLGDSAYADLRRAQEAWPQQPAYAEGLARTAARRGDVPTLMRILGLLARQGTGVAVAADTVVLRLAATDAAIKRQVEALESSLAPIESGRRLVVSADTAFWPEGLDADPRDGTLYVTSMGRRDVLVRTADGQVRWLLRAAEPRPSAVMGIAIDTTRGVAWLATAGHRAMQDYRAADSASSELLRVRLRDGAVERRWRLGDGAGTPGEIGLAPDGEVVVSDAVRAVLYRLRPGADSLERVAHPLLRSPQGIAFAASGGTAWIADWSHGLLRWDRMTGEVSAVAVEPGTTLLGIDGLRRVGDRLLAVQNGVAPTRVVAIMLDGEGRRVVRVTPIDRPAHPDGEPTIGVVLGDRYVYVASSQWPFWTDDLKRVGAAPLPAVVLREVLLPPR